MGTSPLIRRNPGPIPPVPGRVGMGRVARLPGRQSTLPPAENQLSGGKCDQVPEQLGVSPTRLAGCPIERLDLSDVPAAEFAEGTQILRERPTECWAREEFGP